MKLMPQEVEVRYILPSLRKELASSLMKKGLKQREIAKILNITPAAVSQYLKQKRGTTKFKESIQKEVEKSANKIMKDRFSAQREMFKLTDLIKRTHTICEIHKNHDCVPSNCKFCFQR